MTTTRASGGRDVRFACVEGDWSDGGFRYACPRCGGVVVVEAQPLAAEPPVDRSAPGVWRRAALLPRVTAHVSLGEGETPLLDGPDGVRLKVESANPTLSFKDRAMALAVSFALDGGYAGLVVASTGNAAASASAYAARAGLRCRVIVGSESNAAAKLRACRAYGAEVTEVTGDYSAAYAEALALEGEGWLNVSTTFRNPVPGEAYRGVAFELVEQLGRVPAVVCVPIGAGPLLRGIERGFADLQALRGGAVPRLIGVQAQAVSPIVRAWEASPEDPAIWRSTLGDAGARWHTTSATAIADALRGYERQGELTLEAIRATGGAAVAVDEEGIADATRRLRADGLWVEPSSAIALVAAEWEAERADGPVVAVLTGHGIKVPDAD
ncbi:pyridoxal-phosphate dependent enzyme [Leifsonia sp. F6_8S_P_1B]|uniref:Pyridoxal-phosphate dependent enzyme n=1 Tax=Leifsonia williamsii TaxID=3035919 RepID=A0ABT8K661_9MICO|nr:pyridoxal-phosphate dependent enzyme [Leifsonia williamsii]MDN4612939.1 pyridoxal-phosphate dependent enzyme [Leifsonia williamsii]